MKLNIELKNIKAEKYGENITRREALNKAGCLTLSAATMMILMKSQPAKAASYGGSV